MIKSKLLHIALFMCIFSLTMEAQTFLGGQQALDALDAEHISVKLDFITNMSNAGFDNAEDFVLNRPDEAQRFLFLSNSEGLNINSTSNAAQVEDALKILILEKSQDFVPITSAQYDSGVYGSGEIEALYQTFVGIIAQ